MVCVQDRAPPLPEGEAAIVMIARRPREFTGAFPGGKSHTGKKMSFLWMDDHFQTSIPVPGSKEKTINRLSQGKNMGYHVGHIDSFMLNPFQGC